MSMRSKPKFIELRKLAQRLRVEPGERVKLRNADAADSFGWDEDKARLKTQQLCRTLSDLQYKLYADGRFGLLLVLQAIDGGGKDSTIRHIGSALNPQGCTVTSFKQPSAEEQRHDYLWRVHKRVPGRGEIGIFNRSHYEEVLIARVDSLVPRAVWKQRYDQINEFERMLSACDLSIVKIFLHISRNEQRRRLQERLDKPHKRWKFELGDLAKRKQWPDYQSAFEDAINRCSTDFAPWYVVPADFKWARDLAVSQILIEALEALPLRFPEPDYDPKRVRIR